MYTIKISIANNESVLLQQVLPGQTLLEICLRNNIKVNHECGGMCSCKTCHIHVESGAEFLEQASRRETDLLKRIDNSQSTSRLACQCLLMDGTGGIEVTVPAVN